MKYKFRGFVTTDNKWKYGSLIDNQSGVFISGYENINFVVDHDSIGISTGLNDKNNIEIFEGDFIRIIDSEIMYLLSYYDAEWILKGYPSCEEINLSDLNYDELEVVGNIHEN